MGLFRSKPRQNPNPLALTPRSPEHSRRAFERQSRVRALLANIAAVLSGKVVVALAGLATIMLLARHLGPVEFGYYRTAFTFVAFASVFADYGLYMVTLREMSRPGAVPSRVIGTALPLRIASSVTVLALGCALVWVFPYDPVVKWGVVIGAGIYTCLQASDLLIAVFQSVLKQGRNAVAEAAGALLTLGGVALMAFLGGGTLAMLGASAFGVFVALVISWRLAARLVPIRFNLDLRKWRTFIVLGLPLAGSEILMMGILRGDSLVLSLFHPASVVGLYGISTKILEVGTSLSFMFGGLMMPSLTVAASRGREDFPRVLGHTVDTAVIYGVGAVLALAPYAPEVLSLIAGRPYAAGAPALIVMSAAIGLSALSQVLRFSLVACERPRLVLEADAVAFVAGFVAYFALIPKFSLLGAALGVVIAQTCSVLGMLRGVRRVGLPLPSALSLAKAVGAGIIAVGSMMACMEIDIPWYLCLVNGGAVYLLLLSATRAIPPELLSSVFRRREPYHG
jgi:O-antigen/teichoic acid export membrane protein